MSAVSEIMSSKAIVTADINASPSALDIAKLMVKHRIGAVVVTDNGRPIGMITERDILKKVSAQNKNPDEVAARDIMSSPLVTVKAIDSIETAAMAMVNNNVKRLVVMEQDGSATGILSVTDITKKLSKILTDEYDRYGSLKAMLQFMSEA